MRFSIRDLLLVTVIVALVLGWWLERSRAYRQLDESQVKVTELAADGLQQQGCIRQLRDLLQNDGWRVTIYWDFAVEAEKLPNSSAPAPIPPTK